MILLIHLYKHYLITFLGNVNCTVFHFITLQQMGICNYQHLFYLYSYL